MRGTSNLAIIRKKYIRIKRDPHVLQCFPRVTPAVPRHCSLISGMNYVKFHAVSFPVASTIHTNFPEAEKPWEVLSPWDFRSGLPLTMIVTCGWLNFICLKTLGALSLTLPANGGHWSRLAAMGNANPESWFLPFRLLTSGANRAVCNRVVCWVLATGTETLFIWCRSESSCHLKFSCVSQVTSSRTAERERDESIKLARTIAVIFLVYFFCWIPYTIISVSYFLSLDNMTLS